MTSKNMIRKYNNWRVGEEFNERLINFKKVLEKRYGIKLRRNQVINYLVGRQLDIEEQAETQQDGQ